MLMHSTTADTFQRNNIMILIINAKIKYKSTLNAFFRNEQPSIKFALHCDTGLVIYCMINHVYIRSIAFISCKQYFTLCYGSR